MCNTQSSGWDGVQDLWVLLITASPKNSTEHCPFTVTEDLLHAMSNEISLEKKRIGTDFQKARLPYFVKKPVAYHCQLFLASNQKSRSLNANTDCRENERATRLHFQRIPASLSRHLSREGSEWKQLWQVHHDAFHEEMRTSITGSGL